MAGESALSLARALFDEPALRHDLRRRPVPGDLDQVLALIGNDGRQVERVAAALGADPGRLQQAARFYVQEILLFPGADDYRLLGVIPGTDSATLKHHYRILRSWLHPDRTDADPGRTAHAARINAAYRRLRRLLPAETVGGHQSTAVDSRLRTRHWLRVEDPPVRPAGRTLVIAGVAVAVLGGGLWLAWRWPQPPSDVPSWAYEPEPGPDRAGQSPARSDVAETRARRDPMDDPSPPPAASWNEAAPASSPAVATASAPADTATGTRAAALPAQAIATTARVPAPPPSTERDAPGPGAVATSGVASRPAMIAPLPPAPAAAGRAVVPVAVPEAPAAPVASNASAPAPTPAPVAAAAAAAADAHPRDRAVQKRAHALLTFLTRHQAVPPPIWRSGHALDDAEAVRRGLAVGASTRARPQVLFDQVRWEIDGEQVRLQAPIAPADRGTARLLHASFRWHDQDWWVESVSLESGEGATGR